MNFDSLDQGVHEFRGQFTNLGELPESFQKHTQVHSFLLHFVEAAFVLGYGYHQVVLLLLVSGRHPLIPVVRNTTVHIVLIDVGD